MDTGEMETLIQRLRSSSEDLPEVVRQIEAKIEPYRFGPNVQWYGSPLEEEWQNDKRRAYSVGYNSNCKLVFRVLEDSGDPDSFARWEGEPDLLAEASTDFIHRVREPLSNLVELLWKLKDDWSRR